MRCAWCLSRVLANLRKPKHTFSYRVYEVFCNFIFIFHNNDFLIIREESPFYGMALLSEFEFHFFCRLKYNFLKKISHLALFSASHCCFFSVRCLSQRHSQHTWTFFVCGLKLKLKPNHHKSQQLTASKKWIKMLNIN